MSGEDFHEAGAGFSNFIKKKKNNEKIVLFNWK